MAGLFRTESIEAAQESKLGGVQLLMPTSRAVYTAAIFALFATAVAFLLLGSYARRVTVSGQLTSTVGLVQIYAQRAAVVSDLMVRQGERVKKGQPLAEYTVQTASGGMADVDSDISRELQMRKGLATEELGSTGSLFGLKLREVRDRIDFLGRERQQLQGQETLLNEQVDVQSARLQKFEALPAGQFVPQVEVEARKRELTSARLQLKSVQSQITRIDTQIATGRTELATLQLESANRSNEVRNRVSQLNQAVIEAEARRTWRAVSPVDGVVTALAVKPGLMVQPGRLMVTVLPDSSELEATLMVQADAAGFVEPSQRVLLRMNAFPYQKFGHLTGTIRQVDRNPMSAADVQGVYGIDTREPYYLATAVLDRQTIDDVSRQHELLPGMTFLADVTLERRRLIEWVISPALGLKRKLTD